MRVITLLFVSLLFSAQVVFAQHFEWLSHMPGWHSGYGYDIALDTGGNVVYAGRFLGSIDFDPGPNEYELGAFVDNGFVAKLTPNGDFMWARSIGSSDYDRVNEVATDHLGHTYAGGYFERVVDFNPSSGQFTLDGEWGSGFLVKYQYYGWMVWALKIGDEIHGVTTDNAGNVYVTGSFSDTADLDPGPNVLEFIANGEKDVFFMKLNADGEMQWVHCIGGYEGDDIGQSIAISNLGNVYVSGAFRGPTDVDPGVDTLTYGLEFSTNYFVLKLDASGNLIWPLVLRAYSPYLLTSEIAVSPNEDLYLTAASSGLPDAAPGPVSHPLTSHGAEDVFVAKYDANRNFLWAEMFGGGSTDYPYSIDIDEFGNVYTAGMIINGGVFETSNGPLIVPGSGVGNGFLCKHSANGELEWAHIFGDDALDAAGGVVLDENNDVYVTGNFYGTVDFDFSNNVHEVEFQNNYDLFVLKLSYCSQEANIVANGPLVFCEGDSVGLSIDIPGHYYDWSNGDSTATMFVQEEGEYTVVVTDTLGGCEVASMPITVDVVETSVDIDIVAGQNLLETTTVADTYQWLLNGDTIPGATEATYSPSVSGNYLVAIIDENGCTAVSPVLEFTLQVGIEEPNEANGFLISPNPNSGSFTIEGSSLQEVIITDATGKLVRQLNGGLRTQVQIDGLSSGLYIVRAQMANGSVENGKVVVQ